MSRGDRAQATTTPVWAYAVVITAVVMFVVVESVSSTVANAHPQQAHNLCNGFWACGAPPEASLTGLVGLLTIGILGLLLLFLNRTNRGPWE